MDLFDLFRDWDLEPQCHYEQDRNALKRKEWERRNQEVQQDEDLFTSGFNLFGEPYKTNKGDALANRVQNTLGNYDEMKDLLTNHSNQSHLVGIPKNLVPQTPIEKTEQNFFPEQRNRTIQSNQSTSQSCSLMPPPSSLASNSLLHGHQNKKSRTDWSRGNNSSSCVPSNQPSGQQSRSKHNSSHDQFQGKYDDLYSVQSEQHKIVHQGALDDSSPGTSSRSRRHSHSKPSSGDHLYKDSSHSKSPMENGFVSHCSGSPLPSTSLLSGNSNLSAQNFPLHSKPNMVQQKPTAYVRPMDGQDQVLNDSPELKPPVEPEDIYGGQSLGNLLEGKPITANAKNKLPKLTILQPGEVSLPNDSSCVEEILREMTHSWPPPLTAIHTPGKAEQTKFPIPTKESQHVTTGYNGQKRCDTPSKAVTKLLEDDLKLSSDEEDNEQATEKTKYRSIPVINLPLETTHNTGSVHSSGGSGSSSESESSSESDSDSESSSSDSECNEGSHHVTPEPEPPSTNKWQLDKWLNKVNTHNKTIINNQIESHDISNSQSQNNQQSEGQNKGKASITLPQSDSKEKLLLNPIKEKAKPRIAPKNAEAKNLKQKSPAHNEPLTPRTTGKKQPKKVEITPSIEEYNWPKQNNSISAPKEKEVRESQEQPKVRTKLTGNKTAPRKEPRTNTGPTPDKKKHRGTSKIIPKSREFIETDSSSSDTNSEQEESLAAKILPPSTGPTNSSKPKDNTCNSLSVSSLTSSSSGTSLDQASNDLEEQLFSPIPMVQNELLSPLREYEEIKSLWVKIDLSLLFRIPGQEPFETVPIKTESQDINAKHRRQSPALATEKASSKTKRKHKCENSDLFSENKKLRTEKDSSTSCQLPPCISPIPNHKPTSCKDTSKKLSKKREDKLFPPPLSPLSDEPIHKRHSSESSSFNSHESGGISLLQNSSSSVSSSSYKHRKNESKSASHSKIIEEESLSKPSSSLPDISETEVDIWSTMSTLPIENTESKRPMLTFEDIFHNADYYMQEAKKLKHKADALMEKFGKAVNYADAALSFIECGNAMERDPLEAKSPYTMYSETVELIRYAMRLKNFTGSSATEADKKLAVLCYRCLSLLYLRMFKLKKDHAMKYSRSLMEYFKNLSKASQAPSPWGANGKSTGTPSPISLSPSPASSVGSNTGTTGSSSSGTIAIPQRIHHMAASHVNITNNILRSYEHWDSAEKFARENKEFFEELDKMMGPLTQHSSMTNLVHYARQGLHWLRIDANLL
ncbi:AF4/FMR2 family member 2 [Latimeria chalumnae]|uniref:AF4/FMR2 family member 2 n=1 Tax=Latimeria chalumnae TaxID=7897 RepID=UPI0003C0FC7D|nr:PREDICTED: AF4/FMR2 family member 2 isoform X2 [Latimeria chalumnae]|eukprot:XP_005991884.1 PREDICTED: AF4/FMR2 family member 2 isoform X2 [Latimeria chalumnae]